LIQKQDDTYDDGGLPQPPVHYLSAMAIIALDMIWGFMESGVTLTGIGILMLPILSVLVGGFAFLAVAFTQYFIARDRLGASIAKGLALGVLAGVPFPVMGTAVGGVLLGWSGLRALNARN